jgi:uncharacterized repeat protein (TIGR04076 family)
MDIKKETWKKLKWRFIKNHLKYTNEEMELFRKNPRNEEVLDKGIDLQNKRIVIKVVDSQGCNSQHKIGDKFIFDGAGNLLTKHNPDKICIFALNAATSLVFAACELYYAGVDPNEMKFKRSGCFDVGIQCGGWGKIVLEISMADKV